MLEYAQYLHSDPALWRITVDYMYSCGYIGQDMADQVLMRVPLRLHASLSSGAAAADGEDAARIRNGHLAGVLKDVSETCFEHQREGVRRMVCRVRFDLRRGRVRGPLIWCSDIDSGPNAHPRKGIWTCRLLLHICGGLDGLGSGDRPGARRVHCTRQVTCAAWLQAQQHFPLSVAGSVESDLVFLLGPGKFAALVANIAPSLHNVRMDAGTEVRTPAVFSHRLQFAVRFAEFHQRRANGDGQGAAADIAAMFRDEIAPKAWWAVILCDAVELLQYGTSYCCAVGSSAGIANPLPTVSLTRASIFAADGMLFSSNDACMLMEKLEEIHIRVGQGSGDEYLGVLTRIVRGGEKHALQRLQAVRLSLARYYARCGAIGVGGRSRGWNQ